MRNKYVLYMKAFINTAKEWQQAQEEKQIIKRLVFYGVKAVNTTPKPTTYSEAVACFQFASTVKDLVGNLTPVEFMTCFPIEKDFKGHKWEIKDYFHTRDYINTLDQSKPIGDNALEFLMEYTNPEILNFSVACMCYLSDLRRYEGYLDPFEEFMASQGMETANTFKNSKGDVLYARNGKLEKIQKSRPNHLQLVK